MMRLLSVPKDCSVWLRDVGAICTCPASALLSFSQNIIVRAGFITTLAESFGPTSRSLVLTALLKSSKT